MSFFHSKGFKYVKNLIIGLGAALVMLGALYKIQSWEMPTIGGMKFDLLTIGLMTEAFLFTMLGLLPPEKDYYWEKLYPGLDRASGGVAGGAALAGGGGAAPLNGDVVERQLEGMLTELHSMSKSMSSLKALQEVDFSNTKDQLKSMGDFYSRMNQAMVDMANAADDAKVYKERLATLNDNLNSMNNVYSDVAGTVGRMGEAVTELGTTVEETKNYKRQIEQLNNNLSSLNGVYGNVLTAFRG